MLLLQAVLRIISFPTAYIRNFHDARFDLLGGIGMTKLQIERFYWVNLVICAFVLYYLFNSTQQLREAHPLLHPECLPEQSLPNLACLLLAETASIVLLLGAQAEAWVLFRLKNVAANHAIFANIPSRAAAGRRLHRLLWTWFPLVLGVAVYLSQSRFDEVAKWCDELPDGQYSGILHGAKLVWALICPGLLVSFLMAAALNWAFFRWTPSRNLAMTLTIAFASYVLAIAIAGPSDLFGIVKLCRELGATDWKAIFDSITKLVIG